jgi:hypothetical protein
VEARHLPWATSVEVSDQLGPYQPDVYYRVPVGATAEAITIDLDAPYAPPHVATELSVYDGTGRRLTVQRQFPGTGPFSLSLRSTGAPPGPDGLREFFLRVHYEREAADESPAAATGSYVVGGVVQPSDLQPVSFTLEIRREDLGLSLLTRGPGDAGDAFQGTSDVGSAWIPVGTTGTVESVDGEGIPPPSSASDLPGPPAAMPVPVATGPLPSRAAGPLGGIFGPGGDPTTVVDRGRAAAIDLALLDLIPPGDAEAAGEGEAVVALRGPGGFPLVGSAMVATRRAAGTDEGELPPLALDLDEDGPPASGREPAETPRSRLTRIEGLARRAPAWSGVSVALVLVSGAVLPSLTESRPTPRGPRSILRRLLPEGASRSTLG